jgi:hypothetical protein
LETTQTAADATRPAGIAASQPLIAWPQYRDFEIVSL